MDQHSFDRLARLLGGATDRRAGLKAAVGALLGGGAVAAGLDPAPVAEAKRTGRGKDAGPDANKKKRRKTCKPACTAGYVCEKVGRKRACVCPSGVTCGAACCAAGQTCEGGACVDAPDPVACLAFGTPCKDVGKRCCDGMTCASGQDGSFPVACYRAKNAACKRTAECPFGMACTDGRCRGSASPACVQEGGDCSAGTCCDGLTCGEGDACARAGQCIPDGGTGCGGGGTCCSGTSCDGDTCSSLCVSTGLALNARCCTDDQCASGLCWYPQDEDGYPLDGPAGLQKVCLVALNGSCNSDDYGYSQCGLGNECYDQVTTGVYICTDYDDPESYGLKVPTNGTGCDAEHPCYEEYEDWCNASSTCVPRTQRAFREACDPATDVCATQDTTCTHYPVGSGAADTTTTYCLGTNDYANPTGPEDCESYRVWSGYCTRICTVYLTSGTADTDVARGSALKQALADFDWDPVDARASYFLIEPDTSALPDGQKKKYTTEEITLNFGPGDDAYIFTCFDRGGKPKYIVSGNDTNRILNITSQRIFQIHNGIFENGKATASATDDGNGGAIRWDMSNYTPVGGDSSGLNFVTVRNSTADGNGGGLYSIGMPLLSGTSTISGNTAGGQGGGWYAKTLPGKGLLIGNEWSITNNTATTGDGAGFVLDGAALSLTCSSATTPPPGITGNVGTTSGKYDCAYEATPGPAWTNCHCGVPES